MPTQRHKEKRVEERASVLGRKRERVRERKSTHAVGKGRERKSVGTRERERAREHLAPPFICFLPPGPALCKLGSARSAVLPEVLTQVLRPSFVLFSQAFPSLVF